MRRFPASLFLLNAVLSGYIFILNGWANRDLAGIAASVWGALALFAIGSLFTLLPKWLFKLFWTLNLLTAAIAVFSRGQYNIFISEDILLSLLTVESELTAEMVSLPFIAFTVLLGIVPAVLLWRTPVAPQTWKRRAALAVAGAVLGVLAVGGIFQWKGYTFRSKGSIRDSRFMTDIFHFSPLDVYFNGQRAYKAARNLRKNYAHVEILSQKYQYQSKNDDLLLVFVIGESTRGDHFSLNGYGRNTNPQLSQIPNLYSFKHAQSCDTLTINSVHCLASPMLKSSPDRTPRQSSFGEVLHSLGYHTEIYALQSLSEFYKYLNYDKLVSKHQIVAEQQTGAWDAALLPYARQAIGQYRGGKTLLVLHTLGSHQTYADRISPQFQVFKPYCTNPDVSKCSKTELDNAYDNTVLGVDNLLADVIRQLAQSGRKALLFYVSDHGESLGENGNYFHGKPVAVAPKEQFSVPFVVWFSDAYRQTPEGAALAQRVAEAVNSDKAVSHDHIFHSVLGCAGVVSPNGGIDDKLNLCH